MKMEDNSPLKTPKNSDFKKKSKEKEPETLEIQVSEDIGVSEKVGN